MRPVEWMAKRCRTENENEKTMKEDVDNDRPRGRKGSSNSDGSLNQRSHISPDYHPEYHPASLYYALFTLASMYVYLHVFSPLLRGPPAESISPQGTEKRQVSEPSERVLVPLLLSFSPYPYPSSRSGVVVRRYQKRKSNLWYIEVIVFPPGNDRAR